MSVTPSPIGGFAGQFFDNNGQPLSGGKIYTYAAGTTTPQTTYTSSGGLTPHTNPIILDSAGRVPGGEIWLTDGLVYKFKIDTAADILIGTYDNITGVNSNFVNYTIQEEVQTATAGQTVFDLATINYTPGGNSLSVYVDGVNQYVGDSYLETDSDTVTFTTGLHAGAEVKFTTAVPISTGAVAASNVSTAAGISVQSFINRFVYAQDYASLQDALDAAFALYGEGCYVSVAPGYTETLTADLVLSNPNVGIVFTGSALIEQGAYKVVIERAANNAFIISNSFSGNRFGEIEPPFTAAAAYGARFNYTGSGGSGGHGAFEIGDNTGTIEGVNIKGVCIRTDDAGQYAAGIYGRQMTFCRIDQVTISNAGAGTTGWDMAGIILDGAGGGDAYCGYVDIIQPRISGGKYGLWTKGQVNACNVYGGTFNCTASGTGTTYGIYRQGNGTGCVFHDVELASWDECVRIGASTAQDHYLIRTESDAPGVANDFVIESGATRHTATVIGGCETGGGIRVTDNNGAATTNCISFIGNVTAADIYLRNTGFINIPISTGLPTRAFGMTSGDELYVGSVDRPLIGINFLVDGASWAYANGTRFSTLGKVSPGTPAGVTQTATGFYGGSGAPSNADGLNGDFYFRSDGGASTTIYHKRAGSWVGIV